MTEFARDERNKVRRVPQRGAYDSEAIYPIIDAAKICHVGFVAEGQPFVIPTIHARVGDVLYFHGATKSRLIQHMAEGHPVCVTVTLLDGLVLARSAFHHSMNYRSAVVFGTGCLVEDPDEKLEALKAITEHVVPGRWAEARQPNELEMKATGVVSLTIESASAKVRAGGPIDDEDDYALDVWAGVLPYEQAPIAAEPDGRLSEGIAAPEYVTQLLAR